MPFSVQDSATWQTTTFSTSQSVASSSHQRPEEPAAQETRFGGREAAQAEAIGGGYATAQTFHPRRDGRRESQRPPGQVPWMMFLSASIAVGSVWIGGIGSFVIAPLRSLTTNLTMYLFPELGQEVGYRLTGAKLVLASGQWPNRPLPVHATGLSCHSGYGPVALIAERYVVHEVPLNGGHNKDGENELSRTLPPHVEHSIDSCLAQEPAFHSVGIQGVSLECSGPGRCAALLLGATGVQALLCPLNVSGASRFVAGNWQLPTAPVTVQLGSTMEATGWIALVAPKRNEHNLRHWWGLPNATGTASQPTKLKVRFGRASVQRAFPVKCPGCHGQAAHPTTVEVTPSPDARGSLRKASDVDVTSQLSVSAARHPDARVLRNYGDVILGLPLNGNVLRAWILSDSIEAPQAELSAMGTWQLPVERRWAAACADAEYLYAASLTPAEGRGPEIWRFNLPDRVAKL